MIHRTCDTCRHYEPKRWFVPCCTHPRQRNRFGCYAISLARRSDERCGPDAILWEARR